MGFEVWFNEHHYGYEDLEVVEIKVEKHPIKHGGVMEHTTIRIGTKISTMEHWNKEKAKSVTKEELLKLISEYVHAELDSLGYQSGRKKVANYRASELFRQMRELVIGY